MLFALIVYFATEFNDSYSYKYWLFNAIVFLGTTAGTSYAFLIGTIVEKQETLVNINNMFGVLFLLVSGFFTSSVDFAPYMQPLAYLSPFKFCYQALVQNEFTDAPPINCQNSAPQICLALQTRGVFDESLYVNLIALGALIVFYKSMAFICLYIFGRFKV